MVKGIELNIHVGSISTTLLDLIPKGPSQEELQYVWGKEAQAHFPIK